MLTAAVQQSDSGVRTCIYNILFHYGLSQNIFKIIYLFIFACARPRFEAVSSALAGSFFTTEPPAKPPYTI